ncbi:HAD-IA family hydrolase, partial [Candidatus Poribacteria bacterium]|nr:HAD-IA family hydrolase [Candidatus Poribacteria bacterium]
GPLSIVNVRLLHNLSKHAVLPWDCIFSSELAKHYKPDPEVYQTAADLLGLPPNQVMMVAAHPGDLIASSAVGFKTGFVPRPEEYGPNRNRDLEHDVSFDVVADDFNDLASQLGA